MKRFVVPEVEEEQEIVVTMAETGEHPEFHGKVTINGVTISADAEEGILPAGTTLSVSEVTEQVEQIVKEKIEATDSTTVTSVLAYDINLMLDGKKLDNSWAGDGYVTIKFFGERIKENSKEADELEILHLLTPTEIVEAAEGSEAEIPVLDNLNEDNVEVDSEGRDVIDVSGEGATSELEFITDHFSILYDSRKITEYNSNVDNDQRGYTSNKIYNR